MAGKACWWSGTLLGSGEDAGSSLGSGKGAGDALGDVAGVATGVSGVGNEVEEGLERVVAG